jgi:hypothetical protein
VNDYEPDGRRTVACRATDYARLAFPGDERKKADQLSGVRHPSHIHKPVGGKESGRAEEEESDPSWRGRVNINTRALLS